MSYLWYLFLVWLDQHQLVFCFSCKKILFSKDAEWEIAQHTKYPVPLCVKCHKAIFSPFSSELEDYDLYEE
jgi:hypothetical protein